MKAPQYAIYRDEDFLGSGTAIQLARQFNVKPKTIQYMSTPAHRRRIARTKKATHARFVIRIDD